MVSPTPMFTRISYVLALAAIAVVTGCAVGSADREAGPPRTDGVDLAAIHDASSPRFDRACLGCHADIMKRPTLSPTYKEAHAAMIPFLPDYDGKVGVTNANCVSCHSKVDVVQHSGVQIRKNSDTTSCAACHGKTGSAAKKFYVD